MRVSEIRVNDDLLADPDYLQQLLAQTSKFLLQEHSKPKEHISSLYGGVAERVPEPYRFSIKIFVFSWEERHERELTQIYTDEAVYRDVAATLTAAAKDGQTQFTSKEVPGLGLWFTNVERNKYEEAMAY